MLFNVTNVTNYVVTFLTLFSRRPTIDSGCLLFMFRPKRLVFLPVVMGTTEGKQGY